MRPGLSPLFTACRFLLSLVLFVLVFSQTAPAAAAGYKVPEQSSAALALSAAFVAYAKGPAAAYYNPANMVFEGEGAEIELGLSFVRLPPLRFSGSVKGLPADGQSKEESVLLPNIHYIFPKHRALRFGFSLAFPFGLSKRWETPLQKLVAEEFSLKTIELNAAAAVRVNASLSIGGGIRGIYSEGTVKSDGNTSPSLRLTRAVKGDALSPGYYLALSYRPIENFIMAATYRSEVRPEIKGHATLSATGPTGGSYGGATKVEIVLPATAQVATALSYRKATFEFVYERTYWGRYETLDFDYDATLSNAVLVRAFDDPVSKNWSDANTYRFGFSYQYSPPVLFMLGFAIDESPVPEETLNFEIPDADAKIYSLGFFYRPGSRIRIALAYLYADKDQRSVSHNDSAIEGTFASKAQILNGSIAYMF